MNFKTALILFSLLTLVSCGKDLRRALGADHRAEIDRMNDQINDHEKRLTSLENTVSVGASEMAQIQAELDSLESDQTALANSLNGALNTLQDELNDVVEDIAILKGHENIVELIDPCGDGPGFDEVLLKTSSGKLIAYFEVGNKRFLSVLTNGTYQTTDQQACVFQVLNGEVL